VISWRAPVSETVAYYEVERKLGRNHFIKISHIPASQKMSYQFADDNLPGDAVIYRVKAVLHDGTVAYSNNIRLQRTLPGIQVYPNPVHNAFTIQMGGMRSSDYRIELHTLAGQQVKVWKLQNTTVLQQRFERPPSVIPGMYLLKILNLGTGAVTYHKLFFD
jgi:hypothetical protein